jgi:hypothetical protein
MAKKKVMKKKVKNISKKIVKKKVVKKVNSKKVGDKILEKKSRKVTRLLLYSFIVFVISFILYGITSVDPLEAFFGFVVIFSGAVVILGIISELIFFFLKRNGKK